MISHAIDTNVLLVASAFDRTSPFGDTSAPLEVREAAFEWLSGFSHARDRYLLLDDQEAIQGEYRSRLGRRAPQDFGYRVLVDKITKGQAHFIPIKVDRDGNAILPDPLQAAVHDRSDRKFVAVCLSFESESTLVNATDTDWYDAESALRDAGVRLEQIAEHWCRDEWKRKQARK